MEDPSRNLAQKSQLKRGARPHKPPSRWTVLLIGDFGKIVSFHLSTTIVLVLIVFLATVLTIFVYSVVSYNSVRSENRRLRQDLNTLSAHLEGAKSAGEKALVRLMLLEDGIKQTMKNTSSNSDQENKDVGSKPAKSDRDAHETNRAEASKTSKPTATALQPKRPETAQAPQPVPSARISVENLEIWQEPDGRTFKFQFVVKNTKRESGKIAGYAFMVLTPEETSITVPPRAFPQTALKDGKPSNFKNGHYFSIAHYTSIGGTLFDISSINPFKTATVYAYSDTGTLLIERVFDVRKIFRS